MRKFEAINVALDHIQVKNTLDRFDLKIITTDSTSQYFSLTKKEVNEVYKAFEILNKRKWKWWNWVTENC